MYIRLRLNVLQVSDFKTHAILYVLAEKREKNENQAKN